LRFYKAITYTLL
jgi:PadR family transcriptional regulator PadR